jgi:hypothetical protein
VISSEDASRELAAATGQLLGDLEGLSDAQATGRVRVSLQQNPLTASAALVWSGDLPRPLQQMLFDIADSLDEPAQTADLISLTTA